MSAASPLVYVNGQFVPACEASVSVFDRGLLDGDGVREDVRVHDGVASFLDRHLARLERSARVLGLDVPVSRGELVDMVRESGRVTGVREGVLTLVLTRGSGEAGPDAPRCCRPTLALLTGPQRASAGRAAGGLAVTTSSVRRPDPEIAALLAGGLGRVDLVLARAEAERWGGDEALLLDRRGIVSESTAGAVFVVEDGRVVTTPVPWAPATVERTVVLDLAAAEGIETERRALTLHDVQAADEVFLAGTSVGVAPVRVVDGRPFGRGRTGPMALHLAEAFDEVAVEDGVPLDTGDAPAGTPAGGQHRAETSPFLRRT